MKKNRHRILVLWTHPAGYLSASLHQLFKSGCDIFLCHYESDVKAPFNKNLFSWLSKNNLYSFDPFKSNIHYLQDRIKLFNPNVILCAGWSNKEYLYICRIYNNSIKVLCFDTIWKRSIRQLAGTLWSRFFLLPFFDFAFVPGINQKKMAIALGFSEKKIILNLLAPDPNFVKNKYFHNETMINYFLFVGRLSEEKGIKILVNAYKKYRTKINDPWDLYIAGVGPLGPLFIDIQGVNLLGFLQPDALPNLYFNASCLLVPSISESWGVQISEGASAALPIIATRNCGAVPHLLKNNFNGYIVEPGSKDSLCSAMIEMTKTSKLKYFSENSAKLSKNYTPKVFTKNLLEALKTSDKF
jgi:glycosyltransferase involved in cell wall biosynthesis